MRDRFIATLCEIAEHDPRIILITGDLGFAVLDNYRRRFPRQFINAGVAEQNMTLVATGMALEGHIVFTYSIGNFPTLRCLEMIRNDAAYHNANVKVVSVGGGFSYGPLGISHHATEDLAIMRSLPDVTVTAPTSLWEVEQATRAIVQKSGTCFLRLDKDAGPDATMEGADPFQLGKPRTIRRGADVVFFVAGGILSEVVSAADQLRETANITSTIVSVHTLSPIDPKPIVDAIRTHRAVVVVEEHTVAGGLAACILEEASSAEVWPKRFARLGLARCFSSAVGTQGYLRKVYEIDAPAIVRRTQELLSS